MKTKEITQQLKRQEGITLFVTLMLMGVLLGVSASLMNITLKQYQLSGVSYASEVSFQAANAGMECALYNDWVVDGDPSTPVQDSPFDVPNDGSNQSTGSTMNCFNQSTSMALGVATGAEQLFQFPWGSPAVCTEISVYKFAPGDSVTVGGVDMRDPTGTNNNCPAGARDCTVIQSRGYNVTCNDITNAARVVEREYTQVY